MPQEVIKKISISGAAIYLEIVSPEKKNKLRGSGIFIFRKVGGVPPPMKIFKTTKGTIGINPEE